MTDSPTKEHPQFSYRGKLAENPLPEILYTIGQYKVPGVLTFVQSRTTKRIFIRDGRIIFGSSNAAEDHLAEFLFRCGKITRNDLDKSHRLLAFAKGAKRQGEILIELKALPAKELAWAVQSHQQAIIWSLFNWFEGDVRFDVGTFKQDEPILLDITIPRMILDGVRNIHQAKRVITYIGNRCTILEPIENSLLSIEIFGADDKERDILKMVNGKTALYDVCANSPYGAHETAKILYGFLTLKLVRQKSDQVRIISRIPIQKF